MTSCERGPLSCGGRLDSDMLVEERSKRSPPTVIVSGRGLRLTKQESTTAEGRIRGDES